MKQAKYVSSFAIYLEGREVHGQDEADALERELEPLIGENGITRTSLVETLERRERDPGIEAAAHDLYEGAVAIVESGTPPTHRQQRLLREATQRFEERLRTRWKEGATRAAS